MSATALVAMLIICWVPDAGELKEAWRIEKQVTLEHCLAMNQVAAGGGRAGAITVRCGRT
jgi:hypothetical protein